MIKEIQQHRSIRRFSKQSIPQDLIREMLVAATRASTVGTMQLYSIVITTDKELREQLAACHFNQPASKAPALVTFCVDVARFEHWCKLRDANPDYKNFIWFVNGAIDTLLASQNFCLQAESNGLGICYLGTTVYTTDKIIEILQIPHGVIPLTTVAVGYPDEEVGLTHRLPLEAVVHFDTYKNPSDDDINNFWSDTESSELTKKLLIENDLPNLAKIFTEKRYRADDSAMLSQNYIATLKKQGFLK